MQFSFTHTYISGVILLLLFLSTPLTHAEDGTSTASTSPDTIIPASTTDALSTTTDTEAFATQLQEHQSSLEKKKQERTYNLIQNITGRMHAVVFRFEHIAGRIESRAGLLEAQGASLGDTRMHLTQARSELSSAQAILTSDLGRFAWSRNPREEFVHVRSQIQDIGNHLLRARAELTLALNALDAPVPVTASTTDITS